MFQKKNNNNNAKEKLQILKTELKLENVQPFWVKKNDLNNCHCSNFQLIS